MLSLAPPPPWSANAAPEEAEWSSGRAILAGFLLLIGLLILGVVIYFSRNSTDQPDDEQALGESATLVEVASSLPLPWSPGPWICNRKARNGDWYTSAYSPVYSIMWIFLFVWLAMCGVYLIIVGIHVEIEVFRGERHVTAALLIGLALVLCAVWSAIFRLGSKSAAWKEQYATRLAAHRAQQEGKEVKPGETDYDEWEDNPEPDKKHWLTAAAVTLFVAYLLSVIAVGTLRPLTLPGEQYGTLLFLGPGYGLFTGWLLVATSLSVGIAIKAWSYPDTQSNKDERTLAQGTEAESVYPDSWQPLVAAIVGGIIACVCADPTQMLPWIFTFLCFVQFKRRNLYALGAACFFAIVAAVVLSVERS